MTYASPCTVSTQSDQHIRLPVQLHRTHSWLLHVGLLGFSITLYYLLLGAVNRSTQVSSQERPNGPLLIFYDLRSGKHTSSNYSDAVFPCHFSMDEPIQCFGISRGNCTFENENITERQLAAHGDYYSIANCRDNLRQLHIAKCTVLPIPCSQETTADPILGAHSPSYISRYLI